MRIKTEFKTYEDVYLKINKYAADGSICIQAYNREDGMIATLTRCLCDDTLQADETHLDLNNCPWVLDFIYEYGIGEVIEKVKRSAYFIYPTAKINLGVLEKYTLV